MTEILAQIFGIYFIVISISIILNKKYFDKMIQDFWKNPLLVFFIGIIIFISGVALVLQHNLWSTTLEIVISTLLWLTVLKGLFYLWFPRQIEKFAKFFLKHKRIIFWELILIIFLGIYLLSARFDCLGKIF